MVFFIKTVRQFSKYEGTSMQDFYSILYESPQNENVLKEDSNSRKYLDLNLDQIFEKLVKANAAYGFSDVYYEPLRDAYAVKYRQEICRDFDNADFFELYHSFAENINETETEMEEIQTKLSSLHGFENDYYLKSRGLGLANRYCRIVLNMVNFVKGKNITSRGLRSFNDYLKEYASLADFQSLYRDTKELIGKLQGINAVMSINDRTIHIRPFDGQKNMNNEIESLFSRFNSADEKRYTSEHMSESRISPNVSRDLYLMIAQWNKDIFKNLDAFIAKHLYFNDETISRFCREVHFYLSWQTYISPVKRTGLSFCYPEIFDDSSEVFCRDGFDLVLARNLVFDEKRPVTNSFELNPSERIIVLTGPNQGGKTTFARSFGQLFYLASLGLSVPGSMAKLFIPDHIFTHFNMEENAAVHDGKLKDELIRLKAILEQTTEKSVLIINEIFSSTTLKDALELGRIMMSNLSKKRCLALSVTFLDELSTFDEHTVSFVAGVNKEVPGERSFCISRRASDGIAYAEDIARKYHLTYSELKERLAK